MNFEFPAIVVSPHNFIMEFINSNLARLLIHTASPPHLIGAAEVLQRTHVGSAQIQAADAPMAAAFASVPA
jgi:hypothetical protein